MTPDPRAIESLIAFWADGGVNAVYEDAPVNRIAANQRQLVARAQPRGPAAVAPASPAGAAPAPMIDLDEVHALASAAASLEALEAAIAAFEGCALKHAGARRAVFSRGAPDAPVMVIGEAPGADEDMQGAPFVGRAGQLLDKMFAAAGLEGRVFITNTVFWRPPGNRTPTPAEQQACRPFLERAIELVAPKFLLLVGGASAKAMLGAAEGILTLRGRWFEWQSRSGAVELPALAILHPAFLLRQPAAKKKTWADLLTLAERLDRPERPS